MPVVVYAPHKDGHHDPSVGKQVNAFLQKLYEDDTLPGLHIEPITHAADPKVRTGRVTQFYRAVLFKVTGAHEAHYIYTGVWPHDEAIKVAQSATLKANPINGLPELIMASEVEPAPQPAIDRPVKDEPTPLPRLMETVRPDLQPADVASDLGIDEELATRAWSVRDEDEMLDLAGSLGGWRGDALLALAAGERLPDIREALGIDQPMPVDPDATEDERLIAAMKTDAGRMQFAWLEDNDELKRVVEAGDLATWRIFLHPEQRRYVSKDYNGPFRLSGGAGTGKTVVLVHRARRLARDNPDARILLTTYTRNLADGMRRQLKDLDPGVRLADAPGERGVYVAGIDQAAHQVLTRQHAGNTGSAVQAVLSNTNRASARLTKTDKAWRDAVAAADVDLPASLASPGFLSAEYEAVVLPHRARELRDYLRVRRPGRGTPLNRKQRTSVWEVVKAYRTANAVSGDVDFGEVCALAAEAATGAPCFDHVLVDEGQDLTPTRWQFLRAVVPEGSNDLFIAEDSQQRIYGAPIVVGHYGIKIVGRSRRMTLNYRTTEQVLQFATQVLVGEQYSDLEDGSATSSGSRSARSGPEPERVAASSLGDELARAVQVVQRWLADGVVPEGIGVLARDQRMTERVAQGFEDRECPVQLVTRNAGGTGRPQLMTMHRAKGMEFTHVVIIGATADALPASYLLKSVSDAERADMMQRERSLFYVAATRARDELVVMWDGEPTAFLAS